MPERVVGLWLRPCGRWAVPVALTAGSALLGVAGASASAGFLAGAAATVVLFQLAVVDPLLAAASACGRVAGGDLSATVPERGPAPLRAMTSVLNTVLADFQEVLLLFAHSLHSVRSGLGGLDARRHGADGDSLARVVEEIAEMQRMLEGFRYFRVRLQGGAITDTGVVPAAAAASGSPVGTPGGSSR